MEGHVRVCVLGDNGALGSRIASEFNVSAIGLDEQPPDERDGIVLVIGADPAPNSRPLIDTNEAEWRDAAEIAPLRAMRALQRARRVTLAQRGNIVVIAPSVGLIGAAGLSPYVAGIEAIRAMAKSAARQWAADWISVSLIVVPLELIVSGAGDLVPHVGGGARKDIDLLEAVVRAVYFILSGAGPGLTGSTLVVDGGALMVP
jgi:3-oxoacyl-[acyl-carrier protein] reductase